jgi:signal transduction histidine kinase
MAQHGEAWRIPVVGVHVHRRIEWLAPYVAVAVVLCVAGVVIGLRVTNHGAEPEGQNWWLVAELILGLAYIPAGVVLCERRSWRTLGVLFSIVGIAALTEALSTQYLGYGVARHAPLRWPAFASVSSWAWVLGSAVLVGPSLLALLPDRWRVDARLRVAMGLAVVGAGLMVLPHLTATWPSALGSNPLEVSNDTTLGRTVTAGGHVGTVIVDLVATVAVVLLGWRWWQRRQASDDPLPAWLLAGAVAAWLAVIPPGVAIIGQHLPAPDVIQPLLLLATVPLLVIGALIEIVRAAPSGVEQASHRFIEWMLLAAGIVVIYTGLVAGLGRLVGGSGPTWFLVAATGAIALLAEPARRQARTLVDRLVYGARDDPLALVRQVMDHVSAAGDGQELLPALAASLGREMRLDAVAIDVAGQHGWERAAAFGGAAPHDEEIPLHHRGQVVGRLVVGWTDAPSLRPRDAATLHELAAPLALAVSWVRLAAELRRSSLAVVSAREEERRRLRRDLHDGLGPTLTGVSLGLHTAIRQLERTGQHVDVSTSLGLLARLADEIDATVVEVKRIVRDLRPSVLDQLGLLGAVTEFARTLGDAVQLHLELPGQEPALPAAVEVAVYRIVTEALTNVVRHAAAASCWLRIETSDTVDIDVVDDGVGVPPGTPTGVGLAAMRERAEELGGTVTVASNPPHGTRLHVRLPAALP